MVGQHNIPEQTVTVSCIIPSFNEAPRILAVLEVVAKSRFIDEICVVNDGSSDNTDEVLEHFLSSNPEVAERLCYVHLPMNSGKGRALKAGLDSTSGRFILMLDADLQGLTMSNVDKLIIPVLDEQVEMTIASLSRLVYPLITNIDPLSGMRCLTRHILEAMDYTDCRFSIETQINQYIMRNKIPFVPLIDDHARYLTKSQKYGFREGLHLERMMHKDILSHVGLSKFTFLAIGMMYYATKFKHEYVV